MSLRLLSNLRNVRVVLSLRSRVACRIFFSFSGLGPYIVNRLTTTHTQIQHDQYNHYLGVREQTIFHLNLKLEGCTTLSLACRGQAAHRSQEEKRTDCTNMVSAGRQEEDSELQGRSLPSLGLDPKPADDNYPTGSFEVLLERLGSFGPYQIRTFILTSLLDLPACWVAMFFLFGGYNPGFVCVSQAGKALVDNGTFSVTTAPNDTWGADQCQVNGSDCVAIIFNEDYHSALTEVTIY